MPVLKKDEERVFAFFAKALKTKRSIILVAVRDFGRRRGRSFRDWRRWRGWRARKRREKHKDEKHTDAEVFFHGKIQSIEAVVEFNPFETHTNLIHSGQEQQLRFSHPATKPARAESVQVARKQARSAKRQAKRMLG